MPLIKQRELAGIPQGWPNSIPEVLQRIYAARGVLTPEGAEQRMAQLLSPDQLGGIQDAAKLIGDCIIFDKRIMVAGDYDCDGATGSAVAVRGLRMLGARFVDFIVPNRFTHGYGLSSGLVDAMMEFKPDLIVTVDSGVASVEGVAYAKSKGMKVVVTDHHLPGDILPNADAMVNPNLKGDPFPSKMLAGVGVMFYTLNAVRGYLQQQGFWQDGDRPNLASLLDLVALGTVADLVPLDHNNRIIVEAGLRRIRAGQACEGIKALAEVAKKDLAYLVSQDIGFTIAPRLNAAGRLEDMRVGVLTLLEDDPEKARALAKQLDEINKERKEKQAEMITEAENLVLHAMRGCDIGIVVYDPKWHHGIVGLVASRLKEDLYRPTIAFAPAHDGTDEVRGSARSIPGFHLRDALAIVDARNPGMIIKFGGHAMAAGLSLHAKDIENFSYEFDKVAKEMLTAEQLNAVIHVDGELPEGFFTLEFTHYLRRCGPWGQGFPEPVFYNEFECKDYLVLGGKHLKMQLIDPRDGSEVDAIYFNGTDGPEPKGRIRLAFELGANVWKEREYLQLMVRHLEKSKHV